MTDADVATYCIAVHIGAGYHSERHASEYKRLIADACQAAVSVLKKGSASALEAVVTAVKILELHPLTNAGRGSNLSLAGAVECDASVMRGPPHSTFGAVGALPGVLHPVEVACQLAQERRLGPLPLGRIRPIFLVGSGAHDWAQSHAPAALLPAEKSPQGLVTTRARSQWEVYTRMMRAVDGEGDSHADPPQETIAPQRDQDPEGAFKDTVGAVCVDSFGHVAAAVSSGGIAMKFPGRVGEAAAYGAGCWAEEGCGATCSGAGEEIMMALLARSACHLAQTCDEGPSNACQDCLKGLVNNAYNSSSTDAGVLLIQTSAPRRDSTLTCQALILRRREGGQQAVTSFSTMTCL